jgi:hypothetical protein
LALSETKRLFRLFRFYTETESFDVSIEPKKQKTNRNSLIGSKHILLFFTENLGFFLFFGFFRFFRFFVFSFFSVCFQTVYFGCFASKPKQRVLIDRNKQKTHPNSLKESIFGNFSKNLGLFRFVTKQICLFRLFQYRLETPKQTKIFSFWFHETNAKQILFWFVSVRTEIDFCLFQGHPYSLALR